MPLLQPCHVSRSFDATQALSGVDLAVQAGDIIGLVGDDGTGKSTLARVIAGNLPPAGGEMLHEDRPGHFARPLGACPAGIGLVYRNLAPADDLSAAASVFMGRQPTCSVGPFRMDGDRQLCAFPRRLTVVRVAGVQALRRQPARAARCRQLQQRVGRHAAD